MDILNTTFKFVPNDRKNALLLITNNLTAFLHGVHSNQCLKTNKFHIFECCDIYRHQIAVIPLPKIYNNVKKVQITSNSKNV